MSTATRLTCNATQKTYAVATGQTATAGRLAVLASDTTVQNGAVTDLGIGIFRNSGTAGQQVSVYLFGPVVSVVIGTGGCTRGTKAIHIADGFTDAPAHDSSGGTDDRIYGVFLESGVAGDTRGLMMGLGGNRGSA